jgi:dienelactone hydrolase
MSEPIHTARRRGLLPRLAMFLALLCFVPAAFAGVHKVGPGDAVTLAPNEGLLVIAVDSTLDIENLRIDRSGVAIGEGLLRRIGKGRTTQLFAVPAGRYRWKSFTHSVFRYDLGDAAELAFEVKPGVVNYPGDLIVRPQHGMSLHVSNRGLLAMDWLRQQHPQAWSAYELAYTGHYPDPFPARYRDLAAATARTDATADEPASGVLPLPVATLFRPGMLEAVELNGAGNLLAMVTTEPLAPAPTPAAPDAKSKDSRVRKFAALLDLHNARRTPPTQQFVLELIDLQTGQVERLLALPREISRLDWTDDRTLLVSVGVTRDSGRLLAVHAIDEAGKPRRYEVLAVPKAGFVVDPLPGTGHILFASRPALPRQAGVAVHRLDMRTQAAIDDFDFSTSKELDRGVNDDSAWFTDAQGRLRAAVAVREDTEVLLHGQDGVFGEVMALDDPDAFSPVALSADGNRFIGFSAKDREQRDLVEFDPATGKVGRTLFSRPGTDVSDALFDGARRLIGATYLEAGLDVSHYFDADSSRIDRRLRHAFAGRSVSILARDAQARNFILLVGGSDAPEAIYHFNADDNTAALVQHTRPWLEKTRFAPAQVLHARSTDGFDIESYLTLPVGTPGRVPLVVLAHGGPIGVRDTRNFDPEVQFLASLGYAVLQVNFRGSDGYGSQFAEAGRKNYGTRIEDDIDAALAAALAAYPLDAGRMCMMGASYGGYSAMVSAIRWPGRFKCVVSMSGVSDRALFFTASDSGRSEAGREALEAAIGDPRTQMDEMLRYSPLYQVDKLTVPLLLVHGTEDRRVDYEHTRRLVRLLDSVGRPPVLITLQGAGHGIDEDADRKRVYEAVAGFLRANLE